MTEVTVDLNVRVRGQLTFAGYEDIRGEWPKVGTSVLAVEEEDNIEAPAIVVEMNDDARLIYLGVAWREFRERQ